MKHFAALLSIAAVIFTSCTATPYYGKPVVKNATGQLVCGLHGTPVKTVKGYRFDGCITGTTAFEFAARCFPNIRGVGFSETYDKEWATLPSVEYLCEKCEQESARIAKLPAWQVKAAARRTQAKRDRELERAAEKAKRTGNPDDARLPDGHGTVSRVL